MQDFFKMCCFFSISLHRLPRKSSIELKIKKKAFNDQNQTYVEMSIRSCFLMVLEFEKGLLSGVFAIDFYVFLLNDDQN